MTWTTLWRGGLRPQGVLLGAVFTVVALTGCHGHGNRILIGQIKRLVGRTKQSTLRAHHRGSATKPPFAPVASATLIASLLLALAACGGGGGGGSTTPPASNLAPTISTISPMNVQIAGASFTLTVSGSNFASSSVIQWNGTSFPTTFVSSSQLTAQIPAAIIAVPADSAVTVTTPPPGGGTSSAVTLSAIPFMTPTTSSLSRATLDAYLSRSIMMDSWAIQQPFSGDVLTQNSDNLRMLANIGAKHVSWATLFFWTTTSVYNVEAIMTTAGQIVGDIHAQDPSIIVGAGIFETTSAQISNIAIPDWVFQEFNQPVVVRNFDWTKMTYADQRVSDGNPNTPAIDLTQLESRMWYYYWAKRYIDLGFEDLDFGEVFTITQNDIPGYANYWDLVQRVRKYAATNAPRGFVLLSGQSYPADASGKWDNDGVHGIVSSNGYLALDYLYHGLRPEENPNSPQDAIIANWQDVPFNKTAGGISPNGWNCAHMPYVAALDPGGSPNPGIPIGFPSVWGWSEWDWWVNQSQVYRDNWLWYAEAWLAATDPNGHLRIPGMGDGGGLPGIDWYHSNIPWYSQSDPNAPTLNQYFMGFDDEPTIKAIWSGTADPTLLNGDFSRPVLVTGQADITAPPVPSWSFAGAAGVAGVGSAYVGSQALNSGQQVGFISGTGSIEQALLFPGSQTYHVQINAADRVVNGTQDVQSLAVTLDGTTIGAVALSGALATTSLSLGGPTAGVHQLTISGSGAASATAIIASVSIVSP